MLLVGWYDGVRIWCAKIWLNALQLLIIAGDLIITEVKIKPKAARIERCHKDTRYLKIAGLLYLGVIILAGFSEGYVRSQENILSHIGLFRIGMITDLLAFLLDVSLTAYIYLIFKKIHTELAILTILYRLVSHAMVGYNVLHLMNALRVIQVNVDGVTSQQELNQFVLFFLQAHHEGYQLGLLFFGVSCVFLGLLMIVSRQVPNILSIAMILAGGAYLLDGLVHFADPGVSPVIAKVLVWPMVTGECSFMLWLLYRGFLRY